MDMIFDHAQVQDHQCAACYAQALDRVQCNSNAKPTQSQHESGKAHPARREPNANRMLSQRRTNADPARHDFRLNTGERAFQA